MKVNDLKFIQTNFVVYKPTLESRSYTTIGESCCCCWVDQDITANKDCGGHNPLRAHAQSEDNILYGFKLKANQPFPQSTNSKVENLLVSEGGKGGKIRPNDTLWQWKLQTAGSGMGMVLRTKCIGCENESTSSIGISKFVLEQGWSKGFCASFPMENT